MLEMCPVGNEIFTNDIATLNFDLNLDEKSATKHCFWTQFGKNLSNYLVE